ncbi:MAG: helix-turn-helix domain-containing protein [Muribaculaceae bacterium]|nr:helix-turn-helix domain-containing protein [Muribaculaceae bacterium]
MKHPKDEYLQEFGKVVKRIRTSKSGSLNNIAFSRGGVTSATLSRIENAQVDFKFSTLLKLCHTLDISLADLFKDYSYKINLDE